MRLRRARSEAQAGRRLRGDTCGLEGTDFGGGGSVRRGLCTRLGGKPRQHKKQVKLTVNLDKRLLHGHLPDPALDYRLCPQGKATQDEVAGHSENQTRGRARGGAVSDERVTAGQGQARLQGGHSTDTGGTLGDGRAGGIWPHKASRAKHAARTFHVKVRKTQCLLGKGSRRKRTDHTRSHSR